MYNYNMMKKMSGQILSDIASECEMIGEKIAENDCAKQGFG